MDGGSCSDKLVEGDGIEIGGMGMTLETLVVEPGWWRIANDTTDIRECPVEDA
jgi:hypothetical protein